jgi:hypothetical protein
VLRHICGHADVWHTTGEALADWYYAHQWDAVEAYLAQGGAR